MTNDMRNDPDRHRANVRMVERADKAEQRAERAERRRREIDDEAYEYAEKLQKAEADNARLRNLLHMFVNHGVGPNLIDTAKKALVTPPEGEMTDEEKDAIENGQFPEPIEYAPQHAEHNWEPPSVLAEIWSDIDSPQQPAENNATLFRTGDRVQFRYVEPIHMYHLRTGTIVDIDNRFLTVAFDEYKVNATTQMRLQTAREVLYPAPAESQQPEDTLAVNVDDIVTRLYRRFKDWNQRGFTADDVTWCEVRADITDMVHLHRTASAVPEQIRRLPEEWRRINSGHGDYAVAVRKVADQCARELERALAVTPTKGGPGDG